MDICIIVEKYFYFLLILLELEIAASTESQNLAIFICLSIVQRDPSVLYVILLNSELLSELFYGVILSDLVLKYSFEN